MTTDIGDVLPASEEMASRIERSLVAMVRSRTFDQAVMSRLGAVVHEIACEEIELRRGDIRAAVKRAIADGWAEEVSGAAQRALGDALDAVWQKIRPSLEGES